MPFTLQFVVSSVISALLVGATNADLVEDCQGQLGYSLGKVSIADDVPSYTAEQIINLTAKHGVVVLEDIGDVSVADVLQFAGQFGELIELPNGFGSRLSKDESSFIINITNLDAETGAVKDSLVGEYLHNDGDFWQNNHIFSFLYGHVIPPTGGRTEFIDSQLAYQYLQQHHEADILANIAGKFVLSDVHEIPDFKDSPFLDQFSGEHSIGRHAMVSQHAMTNQSVIYYACKFAQVEGLDSDESANLLAALDDVMMNMDAPISYKHVWKPNSMVIWDNTRVMHRSMGGFINHPRKLWRVQARMGPEYSSATEVHVD